MELEYIMRLRYAKCTMGSMENKLNCPLDHGIVYSEEEQPVLNANDHVPMSNIVNFGTCTTLGGPCVPNTLLPWINGKDDLVIEGAPILTSKSMLACFLGGIITIKEE